MSPDFTTSEMSLAWRCGLSHSVKFKCRRPPFTSRCTSQDTGATFEYQGQVVSLLWQSKQARRISALVSGESHAGSLVDGGLVWSWPKGMNWIRMNTANNHPRILRAM